MGRGKEGGWEGRGREGEGSLREERGRDLPLHAPLIHISGYAPGFRGSAVERWSLTGELSLSCAL